MTAGATGPPSLTEIGTVWLLVAFLGGPLVWAVHLVLSYFLVALSCGTGWEGARSGIVIATIVCAVAALGVGAFGMRLGERLRAQGTSGDELDPPSTRGFLALNGAILAVLFAGAIVLAGISPLFLPMCS
ncbi:MAG TPA: hypothetical protein VGQ24_15935 [Gemmatimonadales bacterium]|jgi:hypothetical protein|nr:hypothetical protein [Gemmatimonadales bacterium]